MFKANGRIKNSNKKDRASIEVNTKEFTCGFCKRTDRFSNIEFGEVVKCKSCGQSMHENIQ